MEFLTRGSIHDQRQAMKVIVGQLKKKGLLAPEVDAKDAINLGLDENFEEHVFDETPDDRSLEDDFFYPLRDFDPRSKSDSDEFFESIIQLRDHILAEMHQVIAGSPKKQDSEEAPEEEESKEATPPSPRS